MKYFSLHIWIILLTIIIIFENKIFHTNAKPVKKIVSWYSQIHSKDNPPEIFVQDEEEDESTSVRYKINKNSRNRKNIDSETRREHLDNDLLLFDTNGKENEQKYIDNDTSLNFLQQEEEFFNNRLTEDYHQNRKKSNKPTHKEIGNRQSYHKNVSPNSANRSGKKSHLSHICKKVKRVKSDNETEIRIKHNITLKQMQNLTATLAPLLNISSYNDSRSSFKQKLLLNDQQSSCPVKRVILKPNVNIRDPNMLRSLKQMDLSILSFPPAFMYGNAFSERKLRSNRALNKRYIPGFMLYKNKNPNDDDSSQNDYHDKMNSSAHSFDNSAYKLSYQFSDKGSNMFENISSNESNKLQLPFSNENDSCNMFEALPVLLLKPDGVIVKMDDTNNMIEGIIPQTRSKCIERPKFDLNDIINNATLIPVYLANENTDDLNQQHLVKENSYYHGYSNHEKKSELENFVRLNGMTNINKSWGSPFQQYSWKPSDGKYFPASKEINFSDPGYFKYNLTKAYNDTENHQNNAISYNALKRYEPPKLYISNRSDSNYIEDDAWKGILVNVGGETFMQSEVTAIESYLNNSRLGEGDAKHLYKIPVENNNNISHKNISNNNPKDIEIINKLMSDILSNKMFSNIKVPERSNFKTFSTNIEVCNKVPNTKPFDNCKTPVPIFFTRNNSNDRQKDMCCCTKPRPTELTTNNVAHIKILGFVFENITQTTTEKAIPTSSCEFPLEDGRFNYKNRNFTKFNLNNVYLNKSGYEKNKKYNYMRINSTTLLTECTTELDEFEQQTEIVTFKTHYFTTYPVYNDLLNNRRSENLIKDSNSNVNYCASNSKQDDMKQIDMIEIKKLLTIIKSAIDKEICKSNANNHPNDNIKSNLAKDSIYYKGMNDVLLY